MASKLWQSMDIWMLGCLLVVFSTLSEYCLVLCVRDLARRPAAVAVRPVTKEREQGTKPIILTFSPQEEEVGSSSMLDRARLWFTVEQPVALAARLDYVWRVIVLVFFLLFTIYFIVFEIN